MPPILIIGEGEKKNKNWRCLNNFLLVSLNNKKNFFFFFSTKCFEGFWGGTSLKKKNKGAGGNFFLTTPAVNNGGGGGTCEKKLRGPPHPANKSNSPLGGFAFFFSPHFFQPWGFFNYACSTERLALWVGAGTVVRVLQTGAVAPKNRAFEVLGGHICVFLLQYCDLFSSYLLSLLSEESLVSHYLSWIILISWGPPPVGSVHVFCVY